MKQAIAGVCFITTNGLLRYLKHKRTWKTDEGEQYTRVKWRTCLKRVEKHLKFVWNEPIVSCIPTLSNRYDTVEALDTAASFGPEGKGDLRERAGDIMTYIPELLLVKCWHVQTSHPKKWWWWCIQLPPMTNNASPSVTAILCLPATTAATVTLLFLHLKPPNSSFHAK